MGDANQILTVNLQEALQVFSRVRMQDIRDIRSVDTDLLLVFKGGQQIVWHEGALTVLQKPELVLLFRDGTLKAEQLFKQIEMIHIKEPSVEEDSFWNAAHGLYYADALVQPTELMDVNKWILL